VAGLVNVRGTLVTVVEGWRALGQPEPANGAGGGSTLILELEQGLIGLTVDEVTDMTATSEAPLEDRRGLPGVDPTLVKAVGRRAGQLFVVLNIAALLGPILTSRGEGEQ
jgi:chemotaxis signal transduction protein